MTLWGPRGLTGTRGAVGAAEIQALGELEEAVNVETMVQRSLMLGATELGQVMPQAQKL